MSKLLEFSLKLGLFLALIAGTSTIFFNQKKQQFSTSKFHIALNNIVTVIVVLGSFYLYHVNRDYKDTDDSFLKVTKFVYQVTKYLIAILMYSKPWICREKLLKIFNNSFNLHIKFGDNIDKHKINFIVLLYLGELMKILVIIVTDVLKPYEMEYFVLNCSLHIFGSGIRYILNMYFIIIMWHEQLLKALKTRIKYAVDKFVVYSMNNNVKMNKSKHMIECTKLCDELDECFKVFNDIIVSIKSIHTFMMPILVPEALVLVFDCIATVC